MLWRAGSGAPERYLPVGIPKQVLDAVVPHALVLVLCNSPEGFIEKAICLVEPVDSAR
jgi:hypothetical protein